MIWGKADLGTTSTHTHTHTEQQRFRNKNRQKNKNPKRGGNSAKQHMQQHSTLLFFLVSYRKGNFSHPRVEETLTRESTKGKKNKHLTLGNTHKSAKKPENQNIAMNFISVHTLIIRRLLLFYFGGHSDFATRRIFHPSPGVPCIAPPFPRFMVHL